MAGALHASLFKRQTNHFHIIPCKAWRFITIMIFWKFLTEESALYGIQGQEDNGEWARFTDKDTTTAIRSTRNKRKHLPVTSLWNPRQNHEQFETTNTNWNLLLRFKKNQLTFVNKNTF